MVSFLGVDSWTDELHRVSVYFLPPSPNIFPNSEIIHSHAISVDSCWDTPKAAAEVINLPGVFKIFLLLADKTIKLWKISERDKRPEGYNLKEEDGRYKDPNTITSLRVSPPIRRLIFGDGDYPCHAWVCDADPKIDKTYTQCSTWRQSNFVPLR